MVKLINRMERLIWRKTKKTLAVLALSLGMLIGIGILPATNASAYTTCPTCGKHSGVSLGSYPGLLANGDNGAHYGSVYNVQTALRNLGYACTVDGYYGSNTAKAVREFQYAHCGTLQVDGKVGPSTWAKLQQHC